MRQQTSVSTGLHRAETHDTSKSVTRTDSNAETDGEHVDVVLHPVEPLARIPRLPPVLVSTWPRWAFQHTDQSRTQSKVIDKHPACWLEFTEEAIITSCKNGSLQNSIPRLMMLLFMTSRADGG